MSSNHDRSSDEWSDDPELLTQPGFTIGRLLAVVAVLGFIAFWAYVFANTDSVQHADEFDDPAWSESAESVCAASQGAIAAIPNAAAAESPEERAKLVSLGTDELESMLTDLSGLGLPADPAGAATVPRWLADYETYLDDRRDWTAILRGGEDPPFTISGNDEGVRITDLLATYAEVNHMPSCAPSGDA